MENSVKSNKPLRCLVVDDEPIAREGMVDLIGNVEFLSVAGTCASAMETVAFLQANPVDLLFLDVNMPYLSGLDLLETLEKPPLTILTTAYSEYALEGFRLQVADYLLKPVTFKRFYQAALKAQQTFREREPAQNAIRENQLPYLYVKQNDGFRKIIWSDILYVESMENYVKIVFADNQLTAHQTMTSIEKMLPKDAFFRIHKSFLVNIRHIDSISGGRIFVGNRELPLSRHRKDELLQSVVYRNLIGK
ncbi:MAG: LytTR family DNA-binding domain-containing protein [Tannerella sp.]|jgi:DNA-binding LytR/AlgR family response regulator|nr:LytTR family DNA-binding domain-containing protein [Tannerella sp.]